MPSTADLALAPSPPDVQQALKKLPHAALKKLPHAAMSVRGAVTHRLSIGISVDGKLTGLTTAPVGHARAERPDEMTFESGGQGLWSTRRLIGATASPG
jgi:hypothetical protein